MTSSPTSQRELVDAAVVIVEGVNALQFRDHLDLGVFVDAPEAAIEQWYADRLVAMFAAAPAGSFYAELGFDEARAARRSPTRCGRASIT